MKVCLKCKEEKPFSLFSKNKRNKDGYQIYCKKCKSLEYLNNKDRYLAKAKENYWDKREEKIEYRRQYYKENREKVLAGMKRYHQANPHVKREHYLKINYGITNDDYQTLLTSQNHQCAVCGDSPEYNLVVDHNHDTGEIRGLLCQPCNQALGLLKDSPEIIQSAQNYLKERGHYGPGPSTSP